MRKLDYLRRHLLRNKLPSNWTRQHVKTHLRMRHEKNQRLKDEFKKWIRESLKMDSQYSAEVIKVHLDVIRVLLERAGINVKALETAYSATKQ